MKRYTIKVERQLAELGERIKLARLRRKFSQEIVAKRAGISRPTLTSVEKGEAKVSVGTYATVLMILGLIQDLKQVASDDVLGRKLQDFNLTPKARSPKKKKDE